MTEFDFDAEVRTLFAEDARALLSRMEAASALLVEAQALAPKPFQLLQSAQPFVTIEDAAQSMCGSASSVDAEFLAESASYLEELARRGVRAFDLATAHAARAHAMASFCNDAIREMKAMLTLYIDDAPKEALWLATVLRERAAEVRKADDEVVEAQRGLESAASIAEQLARSPVTKDLAVRLASDRATASAFAFDEPVLPVPLAHSASVPPSEPPNFISDDLLAIFRDEVTGLLEPLNEALGRLDVSLHDAVALEAAQRVFHTLKGIAAAVDQEEMSADAGEIEQLLNGAIEDPRCVDLQLLTTIRAGARKVLAVLGLAGALVDPLEDDEHREGFGLKREAVVVPDDGELWESFEEECTELLDSLERAVLSLEEVARPKPVLAEIFRLIHTLKGAVNTVGLAPTGKVLHTSEDFLEELTNAPTMPPMRNVATILIEVCKEVRNNLSTARQGWVDTSLGPLVLRTESAMPLGTANVRSDQGARDPSRPSKTDSASSSEGTSADERAYIRVATTRLDALMDLAGELVVSRSRMASRMGTLRVLSSELGRSRIRLTETVETFRDQYEFANIGGGKTRRNVAPLAGAKLDRAPLSSVPASMARGDARAGARDVFGELELDEYGDIHVLSRSLAEIGNDFEEAFRTLSSELASFAEDADSLGGIISGIQGEVTRARMVPLDAVFTRLRFPIRDAATRDIKDVRVVTEGADVNIDKTIADAILQPMLHLVRNSVAHGIESPSLRVSLGKERFGTIRLMARQQSGQIVIEVSDDGAGLDLAALRARGIAQGLIRSDVTVDDPRVKELVFASGLSTRDVADDIAGRGVGGEVVKRTIERLNGAIRIESAPGKGTSFVITLPLTLAITRALLVGEGQATYAVPLYFAERILDGESLEVVESGDERRVLLDGVFTRVRRLDDYFGAAPAGRTGGPALVLRVGDERMVLQVDTVLGQEEIVVKGAGELLEGHPLFAGVTLRGTGDLVLIVDVPGLLGELARARATDDVAGPTLGTAFAGPAPAAAPKHVDRASGGEPSLVMPPSRAAFAATQPLGGIRALVVDDSLSVRKVAEGHLRRLGVEVVVAVDGVEGLAKLREGPFDVVFTDLEMPRMNGYDFVRQLRMLAAYRDLLVVVVSSRSGQKHQDHARSVGATDYITKPFSAQSLEMTIRKWLRS